MLRHGADINAINKSGACVLHFAAKFANTSVIEFLLWKGIHVDVKDYDNKTPLLWACQKSSNIDNVLALLKHGADINVINKMSEASALHYAAKFSNVRIIEFMLDKGISVNLMDNDNKTPLLWACNATETVANVKLLLQHGAAISAINKEHGASALHFAALHSDTDMIEFLLSEGISVNKFYNDNETPLLWACQKSDNLRNVTVLIEYGADMTLTDKKYYSTVLHNAAKFSAANMIQFWLDKGISVDVTDRENDTTAMGVSRVKQYRQCDDLTS